MKNVSKKTILHFCKHIVIGTPIACQVSSEEQFPNGEKFATKIFCFCTRDHNKLKKTQKFFSLSRASVHFLDERKNFCLVKKEMMDTFKPKKFI